MPDHNSTLPESSVGTANIKVVGVGGGGQNAVNRMYRERVPEVEYISVNTDSQALDASSVPIRLRVGDQTARGLGVGGDPAKGRQCHEEDRDEIKEVLKGADLVFVAAGMGGGTGTGGAPVVAEVAQEIGALTIGIVTKPFAFEGAVRKKKAIEGIDMLREKVDTLIVIPNDRLIAISDEQLTMDRAFKMADDVLSQGIRSIAEIILQPGEINLDFADVRAIMENAGPAWMAIGSGSGANRALDAAEQAINSPLLEVEIDGAKGVLYNITGGTDLTLEEVQKASELIASTVHPDANIIFGMFTDPKMENEVNITLIATGFPVAAEVEEEAASVARKALDDPASMAIPPFLRHHPAARTRYRNGGMYRDTEQAQREETAVMADD
jgi:cell division protein FtsZ